MADTLGNPYAYNAPIGQAFANFAKAFTSGPSDADRIKSAEEALKLKRQREALTSLSDIFGLYGQPGFDRNSAMSEAILGGYNPSNLADLERYGAANTYGAEDQRTTNAFVGAGGAYGSTAAGFGKTLAETSRNNDQQSADRRYGVDQNNAAENYRFGATPKPALDANGKPIFAPQGNLTQPGYSPILSDTERKGTVVGQNWGNLGALPPAEQRYIGSDPSQTKPTPHNYIGPDGHSYITYDGVVDAQSGRLLPPGGYIAGVNAPDAAAAGLTTANKTTLQNQHLAQDTFSRMLDYTEGLVKQNPANVGASGVIKGFAQDITQLAANVAQGLGFKGLQDAVNSVRSQATSNGINPSILSGVFDPNLPALQTSYDLLVYSAASALAEQSSRSVSDRDIQIIKGIVGSPTDLFGSQEKSLAKFQTLRGILEIKQGVTNDALGAKGVPGPQTSVTTPTTPKQAAATSQAINTKPGTIGAVTDQPTRAANAQGYGDHLTGAMTVNGRTYKWGSGGGGRGSIPFGDYHVQDFMTGPQRAAAGYEFKRDSFMLSDTKDPLIPGQAPRSGLLIHDSQYGYTAGCIGVQGDFKQFEQDLLAEAQKVGGIKNVVIHVGPGGPSIGAAPAAAPAATGPVDFRAGVAPPVTGFGAGTPDVGTLVPRDSAPSFDVGGFGGAPPMVTPPGPSGPTAAQITGNNGSQVISPRGDVVPKSFIDAGNDPDLWDRMSPDFKQRWKAERGP